MLRAALSAAAAFGLMAVAVSAQDNFDCGKAYEVIREKLRRERSAKVPSEQLAALNRKAQRVYNACQIGHLQNPKALFEGLDRGKN